MKLSEALSIVGSVPADTPEFPVLLACGFTPLHLQNYLAAHLQQNLNNRRVQIVSGLYGDLAGTLENVAEAAPQACAVVLEWADLDSRLGYRKLGGWGQCVTGSILESAQAMLQRIEAAIRPLPSTIPVAVSLPSLPLPPGFHTTGWQASSTEVALEEAVAHFAKRISEHPAVRLVNRQRLDAVSSPQARYDLRSDIHTGFPYTLSHADALGAALASLLQSPQPKKGLITDLDDTLWLGLVGEDGHQSVTWEATTKGHLHGLFQQMLSALAAHGVLVAIASKNSPEIAEKALARPDLLIPREKIFPIEIHWEPKSESVARILNTWNLSADSIVFVDDSPMELAEVRAAHPGIECLLFPKADYTQGLAFLRRLRDLFGKAHLSEEDSFRLDSIRQAPQFDTAASAEGFLERAEAVVTMHYDPPASDTRVVELVNKTNQFNLNGIRYTEAEWQEALRQPRSFCAAVSYRDKFGPLGKIAVIRGKEEGKRLAIATWVMSCRAFSRRIEYQSLLQIFRKFSPGEIVFEYRATGRNAPIQAFLTQVLEQPPAPDIRLTFDQFEARRPKLYHKVIENQ
ncbi:MAG TPA: HAD-IIIC family phosphatase [Bryobacteraceae bacterium]|nr:HAD-IIIC family phosphatase [Bryobacteraceae bacterium]